MAIDATWIALVGTVCGGVGLKVAEHWLGRNKVKIDDAAQIRDELRLEINTNREEIRSLEEGLEEWRKKYYELFEAHIALQTELTIAKREILEAWSKVEEISKQRATLDKTKDDGVG
jgi:chromosome segregation ATPase